MELLAPAGDFNRLKLAIAYGADAVYLGGEKFGLRAPAGINNDELEAAVNSAHSKNIKVYVTVNIFARNSDFNELVIYAKYLEKIKVDAVIVSDLGVLALFCKNTKLDIHISTQANVINKYTAGEYVKLGAKRIILARELNIKEIEEIANHLKNKCEIEVFVHGAMCVSYSGRCMLSSYMTGREANRGECAHPCRYKYALMEEKRAGEYFPIKEDKGGTYILNSKDLCLIEHLDELEKAGVTSIKIEGRNKSEYYVAGIVNAYKRRDINEVFKIPHRPYTTGFVFSNGGETDTMFHEYSRPDSSYEVTARCLGGTTVEQRNVFSDGDELEILSWRDPYYNKTFVVSGVGRANKAGGTYEIKCPYELLDGEFLRKKID